MKVSIQSIRQRTTLVPGSALAAVAVSLLSIASACGGDSGSMTQAPFTGAPAAGTTAAPGVAGTPGTTPAATTPPATAAGNRAPTAAAGIGVTATAGSIAPATAGTGTTTGAAAGSGTTGAAGTGSPAGAAGGAAAPSGSATFTAVLAILNAEKNTCGLCHKMATIGGGLVFDPADRMGTYTALVGQVSKGTMGSTCGGKTYVVAGKPDESLLYDKVSKATPSCGLRMPASGGVLEDAEIATIRAWIMAGALNN